MTKTDAIVAITAIVGVTALGITGAIFSRKKEKEFAAEREVFNNAHKVDDMVDKASVENDLLETAEDKALAKKLMNDSKETMESSTTISTYKANCESFLKLYSDLTDGTPDKVKANLLYFKNEKEEDDKRQATLAAERAQANLINSYRSHEIDKINAVRKIIEVAKPDAYTIGKFYEGMSNAITSRSQAASAPQKEEVVTDAE